MDNIKDFKSSIKIRKQNSNFNSANINSLLKGLAVTIIGIIVLFILVSSFTFTVNETQQAVVTQFDRIVSIIVDDINDPSIQALRKTLDMQI